MADCETRHISFEACFNFRDLGGYPTEDGRKLRWKTLYRSDTLHRLTASDAEVFAALGVQTVIDLRSGNEVVDYGRLRAEAGDVAWYHSPILDRLQGRSPADSGRPSEALGPGEFYMRLLEAYQPSVAQTFRLFASDGALPAVFHCTGGRDRTGMVAALVLDLVGVSDEVIANDYLLTQRASDRTRAWIEANEPELMLLAAHVPPEIRELRREVILGFLERVREKYGSAAGFLSSAGVTKGEQQRLGQRLVEDYS